MNADEIVRSPHPHDAFAIYMFSDPERARALLQNNLPPAIVAQIDWATLTLEPSSFIRHDLQKSQSDLLFNASSWT
jgi:predicted transposase YdaD